MARVLTGQNNRSITDLLYCRDDTALSRYSEQSRERISRYSDNFRERSRELTESIRDNYVTRRALGAYRKLRNAGRPNAIEQLFDIGALQHARPIMQRVIMSSKAIRNLYNRKLLEGYGGDYRYDNKHAIGDTDVTYRQINQGVTSDGWATTYVMSEQIANEFDWIDRADARISIGEAERMIAEGNDDPTSQFNAGLSKF